MDNSVDGYIFFRIGQIENSDEIIYRLSEFSIDNLFKLKQTLYFMVYAVYTTENFEREMKKLSGEEQERVKKMFLQFKDNPYVGDQLRYRFLREKRLSEKRVYYLVYDELLAVLVVAISGKKDQKETIEHVVRYLELYKEYIKEKIMED